MRAFELLSLLALAALPASAKPAPKTPAPPQLTYLYEMNVTAGAPVTIGAGPRGTRMAYPIISGEVAGPKLKATVIPSIGGDIAMLDANNPKGSFQPNIQGVFTTDDGANVFVSINGELQSDGATVLVRAAFETGNLDYYWLNTVIAVGVLKTISKTPTGGLNIHYDMWEVQLPKA